ncbi:hypothetical protein OG764_19350 [Streptomyces sp. NBC_00239]
MAHGTGNTGGGAGSGGAAEGADGLLATMGIEEKRAWIMAVVSACGYAAYLVAVLGTAGGTPLAEAPYEAALLWTVGAAIAVSIALNIAAALGSRGDGGRTDQRDREIHRYGEHIGQSFVVTGGIAALVMAMAETAPFWIANTLYLAFVLSALLGSTAKIVAYRWGFRPW